MNSSPDGSTGSTRRSVLASTVGALTLGVSGCARLARTGARGADELAGGARYGVRLADDIGREVGEARREAGAATYRIDRDVTVTAEGPALEVPLASRGVADVDVAIEWSFLVRDGGPVWLGVMTTDEYRYYVNHQRFETITQSGLPAGEGDGRGTAPAGDYVVRMDKLQNIDADGNFSPPEPSTVSLSISFTLGGS